MKKVIILITMLITLVGINAFNGVYASVEVNSLFNQDGAVNARMASAIMNEVNNNSNDVIEINLFPIIGSVNQNVNSLSRLTWRLVMVSEDALTFYATQPYRNSIWGQTPVDYEASILRQNMNTDWELFSGYLNVGEHIVLSGLNDYIFVPSRLVLENEWGMNTNALRVFDRNNFSRDAWLATTTNTNVSGVRDNGNINNIGAHQEHSVRPAINISIDSLEQAIQSNKWLSVDFGLRYQHAGHTQYQYITVVEGSNVFNLFISDEGLDSFRYGAEIERNERVWSNTDGTVVNYWVSYDIVGLHGSATDQIRNADMNEPWYYNIDFYGDVEIYIFGDYRSGSHEFQKEYLLTVGAGMRLVVQMFGMDGHADLHLVDAEVETKILSLEMDLFDLIFVFAGFEECDQEVDTGTCDDYDCDYYDCEGDEREFSTRDLILLGFAGIGAIAVLMLLFGFLGKVFGSKNKKRRR